MVKKSNLKKEKVPKPKEERKPGESLKDIQQELFCQIYAGAGEHFGNGVWSYVLAYSVDLPFISYSQLKGERKKVYVNAKTKAHQLLTKLHIKERCNEILDSHIKHEIVDRETVRVILQNKELGPKVAAIREYNDVNERINEKIEITIKQKYAGKSLEQLITRRKEIYRELRARDGRDSSGSGKENRN